MALLGNDKKWFTGRTVDKWSRFASHTVKCANMKDCCSNDLDALMSVKEREVATFC